jgi:rhomboid protease GluP
MGIEGGGRPDGTIDFAGYSTEQLRDLEWTLDRNNRPLDFAHLQAALAARDGAQSATPSERGVWAIQFTRRSGLLGWLRAKTKRLRLYGSGSIEIGAAQVILCGWQRTWLGMPLQVELPIAVGEIRNVAQDERSVRFEVHHGARRRRYAFRLESNDSAARLISLLPAAQTPGFDQGWRERREFNRSLRAQGAPRVTQTLVALNFLVFIAMAIATRQVLAFGLQDLERWGANNGPLTTGGQWWRLLSAAFLHLSPIHLLINMWVLWNVGRLAERLFGRWTFLALYLAAAVLASLSSIAWNPLLFSAGASGAIFGVLGAFLAYLVKRQTRVPAAVFRAYWVSTLAFVLFNLISGALQTDIDNGAHVGGLLAGFCLGWILARPLEDPPRRPLPPGRMLAAAAVVLALALAGLWQVEGSKSQLTATQQYFQSRLWYVDGESRDVALWQSLIAQTQSGAVSTSYVGEQFKARIVPFWQSSYDRLRAERLPQSQRQIGALVLDFVRLRLAWSQSIVALAAADSSQGEQHATELANQTNLVLARVLRLSMLQTAASRPPGLVNSPLIERLRQLLWANRWQCVAPPASLVAPLGRHDLRTDWPVVASRVACSAQRDFVHHDFGGLEDLLRVGNPFADLPAGGSTYGAAVVGIDQLIDYGRLTMPQVLRLTAEWRRAYPRSPLPTLIEAMAFEDWAWAARGSGYANSVSGASWMLFSARIEMAAASLRAAPKTAGATPLWYQLSLEVGIAQSRDLAALRGIFDAGAAPFPDYMPLYRQMLRALMPRWLGSYLKVDQFINAEYANSAPRLGFQLYTRLYWMFADLSGDDVDIFTDGLADWNSMKRGFAQLGVRYPRSDYLLNVFASFACRAGDKTEYAALRQQVAARFSASAWSGKFTLADCDQSMGLPGHPAVTSRRPRRQ